MHLIFKAVEFRLLNKQLLCCFSSDIQCCSFWEAKAQTITLNPLVAGSVFLPLYNDACFPPKKEEKKRIVVNYLRGTGNSINAQYVFPSHTPIKHSQIQKIILC